MKLYPLNKETVAMYQCQVEVIKILYRALRSKYIIKHKDYDRKELKRLLGCANRGLSFIQTGVKPKGRIIRAYIKGVGVSEYYRKLELLLNKIK